MKKNVFKIGSAIIAGIMLLSGCSSNNSQAIGAVGNAQAASKEEAQTASEKTVIEYWHVNAETQGGMTVDELVKNFNQSNDHIEVVARYNPDMYKGLMQNLQAEAATGKSPAIVQVGWAFLDYFSNNFQYTEPQQVIDQFDSEDKTFLDDKFLPNILELAKNSNGSQVGIPYSLSTPVLYYNKDMFKEAGLPEEGPETWEQVISYAKTIKDKTGNFGFYMQEPADNWAQQAFMESNGAKMLTNEGGKVKATFASAEGIKAYQTLSDMVNVDKSALHISWDEGMQSFVNGNVGMVYTTIARRANVQNSAQFDVAAVSSPVWEGKKRTVPAGGCFLAITATTDEQKKAAWEFEKYLYSVEAMAAWTVGTGYVPPRKDVSEAENGLKAFLAENKMMEAATSQMGDVVSWTSFPGDAGLISEQTLLDVRDQILSGQVTAEKGLTDAQNTINSLLEKQ